MSPNARAQATRKTTRILTSRLFDSFTRSIVKNQQIIVDDASGLILDVKDWAEHDLVDNNGHVKTIDLRSTQLVLPGFVDTHVHFFLHAYSETSWDEQLTRESIAERTIRAVTHARKTLAAGYTAVRDLGTEGAGDADISLRKSISSPLNLIPGPRYFCANRAIVSTGAYGPKHDITLNKEGVQGITGAEVADGVVECTKAVRRQVGAGADWIKIYVDYKVRSRIGSTAPTISRRDYPLFTGDEIKAICSTAHGLGVKVAGHFKKTAMSDDLSLHLIDTIEHGTEMIPTDPKAAQISFDALARGAKVWSPTLSAYKLAGEESDWQACASTFQRALEYNRTARAAGEREIPFACGGDAGAYEHGRNSLEMALMVQLGAHPVEVLSWGTLGGWRTIRSRAWDDEVSRGTETERRRLKALRERLARNDGAPLNKEELGDNDVPFGALTSGFAADIIALGGEEGDLEKDFTRAVSSENVLFVMKGGKVFKHNGRFDM